jgi:hypothetical protein
LSLVGSLLQCGYRAVIGTQTVISDKLASRFFKALYSHLLDGSSTVGGAVHLARLELLLSEDANPLGCLFTLHGDPDLAVDRH